MTLEPSEWLVITYIGGSSLCVCSTLPAEIQQEVGVFTGRWDKWPSAAHRLLHTRVPACVTHQSPAGSSVSCYNQHFLRVSLLTVRGAEAHHMQLGFLIFCLMFCLTGWGILF